MRMFESPLAPQSGIGRVVVGVLVALFATVALLAWSPANAYDSDAPEVAQPQGALHGWVRCTSARTQHEVRVASVGEA